MIAHPPDAKEPPALIFSPAHARAIASGRKTQHRRLVTTKPSRLRIGETYTVRPNTKSKDQRDILAHIKLTDLGEERLGQITHQAAKAEGFKNTAQFKAWWVEVHDNTEWDGDGPTEAQRLAIFDTKFAHKFVTVLTFELTHDVPRFLADQRVSHTADDGQYTPTPHRAIDDLEVIDAVTAARYAKKAAEQAASFKRDLEHERQQRRNARLAMFRNAA